LEKEKRCALESWGGTCCELRPPANPENLSRLLGLSGGLCQKSRVGSLCMMKIKEVFRGVDGLGCRGVCCPLGRGLLMNNGSGSCSRCRHKNKCKHSLL